LSHPLSFVKSILIRRGMFCTCVILLMYTAGCGNTCFVGIVNPPNNGVLVAGGSAASTCSLNQTMAVVKITADLVPMCTNCAATQQIAHVHLAVSGIELHPGAVADENSPEWQELAPDLAQQPRSIDLAANSTSRDLEAALNVTGKISEGTYYQLRIRLAEVSSLNAEQLSATKFCGSMRGACVVNAAGAVHPLQTLDDLAFLRVELESPFEVRAGQLNHLHFEFSPDWAMRNSSRGVMELAPLLRGRVVAESAASAGSF
jgi:Domain of unknown function (DUF4382)